MQLRPQHPRDRLTWAASFHFGRESPAPFCVGGHSAGQGRLVVKRRTEEGLKTKGIASMKEISSFDQTDEEILTFTAPDAALEIAAQQATGSYTFVSE